MDLEKKGRLIRQMLDEMEIYWIHFEKPLSMSILAAKYSRAMISVGGFREIMKELETDGTLIVVMNEKMSRFVYTPAWLKGQMIA